jgi:hypothetical protein
MISVKLYADLFSSVIVTHPMWVYFRADSQDNATPVFLNDVYSRLVLCTGSYIYSIQHVISTFDHI